MVQQSRELVGRIFGAQPDRFCQVIDPVGCENLREALEKGLVLTWGDGAGPVIGRAVELVVGPDGKMAARFVLTE